ncbi:MAG: DUF927 domain-containing protein [Ruminococcus sp.]|nr:DUF927 domain-containing protein [Ruminococcus sp.]
MKNSNETNFNEVEIVDHEPLSFDDEWVLESFDNSPVRPVTIVGDMMYYPNEDGDGLDWLSVRMEVVEYNNNETSNEKTITIRAVPERFPEEEKEFKANILEKRTFAEVLKYGYVYNNAYLEELINYMQQSAAKAPHFITYNRVGWKEENVKTKNGTKTKDIFRTDKLICNGTNKQNKFQFRYIGSLKFDSKQIVADYIVALNALLTTKGLQFAIVAGLSSVILSRMNMFTAIGSLIIHIYGDSS